MNKSEVLTLASKNLSNNFKGQKEEIMSTLAATANKFRADIANTGTSAVNIAIIPGHYRVDGIGMLGGTEPFIHYHDLTELKKAGIIVQAVLDDGDQTVTGGGTVTCTPSDPAFSIRSFLEYIKFNPMLVQQMSIRSPKGDVGVYANNLKLSKTNPFNRTEEIPISLERFFSVEQYQDTRIDFSMIETGLAISQDLMMILTIPANSSLGIDLYFAN